MAKATFVGNKGFNRAQCDLLEKRRLEMGYTVSHLAKLVNRSAVLYYNIVNGKVWSPSIYCFLRELHIDRAEFANLGVALPEPPTVNADRTETVIVHGEPVEIPSARVEEKKEEKKEDRRVVNVELDTSRIDQLFYLLVDISKELVTEEDVRRFLISKIPGEFKTKFIVDYIKGADVFR